ncbi:aromatic-ring-hydroxylating dioxygenase subunit beta [Novosphingobium pentaromativorans]|uniref:Uncharacterized protein n=1 Tax=Novosphingobium pentaromativorans US6-1 TaxID=1088721 RepID=G6EGM8_9SPHN|nr:aromatic-ring-hydroxylating dioxygenase subunit beta [Novosphingobium pentaromativorans]AIT82146.1 hypothetical protein JI59_21710 [Novosphingobium pentaromativorans US6-1]EHJ59575.1 hypothetical protein NSU_3458 [Novosphingobium pentaromativorans US6-1]
MTTINATPAENADAAARKAVSMEVHHSIEQFLYAEAAILDRDDLGYWVNSVLDPGIRYQMVVQADRHVRDKAPLSQRELMIYDDDLTALKLRVRQFDTGLQRMMDPRQHIRRFISNVRVVETETPGEFEVTSYGKAYRFRREYDKDEVVYQRTDLLRQGGDEGFILLKRRIDLFERVIRSKNLLFFL